MTSKGFYIEIEPAREAWTRWKSQVRKDEKESEIRHSAAYGGKNAVYKTEVPRVPRICGVIPRKRFRSHHYA